MARPLGRPSGLASVHSRGAPPRLQPWPRPLALLWAELGWRGHEDHLTALGTLVSPCA